MTSTLQPQPGLPGSPVVNEHGTTLADIQARLWHFLSPAVASDCGLNLQDLQALMTGTRIPDNATLHLLARRIGLVR